MKESTRNALERIFTLAENNHGEISTKEIEKCGISITTFRKYVNYDVIWDEYDKFFSIEEIVRTLNSLVDSFSHYISEEDEEFRIPEQEFKINENGQIYQHICDNYRYANLKLK